MADDETGAFTGVREALVRLDERVKQAATREEMNNADFRNLTEFSGIMERANASQREYVRERVREGALETTNRLQDMEKHLTAGISALAATQAGIAAQLALMNTPAEGRKGWHPAVTYPAAGAGGGVLTIIIYLLTGGHFGGPN